MIRQFEEPLFINIFDKIGGLTTPQTISPEEVRTAPLQTAGRFLGERFRESQKAMEELAPTIGGRKIDIMGAAAPLKAIKAGQVITKEAPRELKIIVNKINENVLAIKKQFLNSPQGIAYERKAKNAISQQYHYLNKLRQNLADSGKDDLANFVDDFKSQILSEKENIREGKLKIFKEAPRIFKGFKDLTTKFLEYAKGKTTLSKQEITDFARRPELKKGEADDLNNLVKNLSEGKHSVEEITDALRFGSEKYGTRGVLELKPVKVKEPQYQSLTIKGADNRKLGTGGKYIDYEEVVFESPITTNGSSHYPNSEKYFAHARGGGIKENGKKIWEENEIQSDLLQKGRLEQIAEGKRNIIDSNDPRVLNETRNLETRNLEKLQQLEPFTNDRFGERIMRERIKEKASKGYEKYRLPTGKTIGKIEGFEAHNWYKGESYFDRQFDTYNIRIKPEELKVGEIVRQGVGRESQPWIITDILGDGRFKAVNKEVYEKSKNLDPRNLDTPKEFLNRYAETHDLTGKSNPQYRRYENWGKFLKNKYGGKEVIDPQGNSWMEIDLKPEYKRMPIEAFGAIPFVFPQKEENRREIFGEPLFINK